MQTNTIQTDVSKMTGDELVAYADRVARGVIAQLCGSDAELPGFRLIYEDAIKAGAFDGCRTYGERAAALLRWQADQIDARAARRAGA